MAEEPMTHAELEAVIKALDYVLPELRYEIADTDDAAFRRKLKEEEALLRAARDKLDLQLAALSRERYV